MSAAAAARDQLHQLVDLVDDAAVEAAAAEDAAALPARGHSPVWAKGLARLQAEETDTPLVLRIASNPFEGEPEMSPIPEELEDRSFSAGTAPASAKSAKSPGEPEVRKHNSRRRKPSKGARLPHASPQPAPAASLTALFALPRAFPSG